MTVRDSNMGEISYQHDKRFRDEIKSYIIRFLHKMNDIQEMDPSKLYNKFLLFI